MSEPRLWERIRKLELQAQKLCLDLSQIGKELRAAKKSQIQWGKEKNEKQVKQVKRTGGQ